MKAEIIINKNFTIGEIDKRIYGSFIEHIGRAVYGGIYEPEHKLSDKDGFRTDVLELIKEIDVPLVRYPGGNFVSGYNWEDGTGEKSLRPRRQELAWESIETNEVGIDEFQEWAKAANTEIGMAVNLGTRGPVEAQNLVEYCNSDRDTYYANMRRKNGFDKPFNIKTWCLGNEMYGSWQICRKTADEYGHIAEEAGKMMKLTDPDIELVLCGTNCESPVFADWNLTVLDYAYNCADYISLHQYYSNKENNTPDFLGRSVHMDSFIKSVVAMCDSIKAKKHSQKTLNLAFDEWNVWDSAEKIKCEKWQVAPPILEDVYSFEDALVVGCMLMTLQNNCDRVKIACLAQLVNVIAPIMTETGGSAWTQTIFYPYMYASQNGRGTVMEKLTKCETYQTSDNLTVPYIESSVIVNEEKREIVVFALNRSLTEDMQLSLELGGFDTACLKEHVELYCENLKETNTKTAQKVKPILREINEIKGENQEVVLKKHSWNMIRLAY